MDTSAENKEYSGIQNAEANVAARNTQMEKFHASQPHGFAAEQANNMIDRFKGKESTVIGGDNAKNGADRLVNGNLVQVKYHQTASQSVGSAFEGGKYRYIAPDGTPMKLEVPSDQYEAAVEAMRKRIEKGEVPGVTDPAQAEELISKGHITYQQACNIAKAGTVESLVFDAANGAVYAANAFGISATVVFALSCWKGENISDSIEKAVVTGLQVGGTAFVTNIAVSQLNRMGVNKLLTPASEQLVKLLGKKNAEYLAMALKDSADVAGEEAMNNIAKLLKCNAITSVVTIAVLSAKDVKHAIQGKISGKQLVKDVAITSGAVGGASGGAVIGMGVGAAAGGAVGGPAGIAIGSKIGKVAGGALGGFFGGAAANKVTGAFIEDDAVELLSIIETEFEKIAFDNLLTKDEIELSVDELRANLTKDQFYNMHASPSPTDYADDLIMSVINRILCFRAKVSLPSSSQMLSGLIHVGEHYVNESGIFSRGDEGQSATEVGKSLTGRECSDLASKKALYVAKQSNATQMVKELTLYTMKQNEFDAANNSHRIDQDTVDKKRILNELLNEGGM